MGLLDNLKNVLGGKKGDSIEASTKAPSQILKEAGVDPSGLKFEFGADGTVTISGSVQQEGDKAKIKELLAGVPGMKKIEQNLSVANPAPATAAEEPASPASPEPSQDDSASASASPTETSASSGEPAGDTYTVQSGDTLWKIASQFYGNGSEYMKIFEANTDILKDPDHIYPGQELKIPPKDED